MVDTWKEVAFKEPSKLLILLHGRKVLKRLGLTALQVSAMRYLLCSPVISAQWRKP